VINKRHKIIYAIIFMIFVWCISAWSIAKSYYIERTNEIAAQKYKLSQERAEDLANSIQRNLNYLHGIPDLLSQSILVRKVAVRFGPDSTPSSLPLEVRKTRWTKDSQLNDLDRYLELVKTSLQADIIFVINTAGDCIAASNWDVQGNTVGTNFADREYFKKNKEGQRGMQYAVGKTTHIPGMYFSTPVVVDGHFLGAVVAKTDVPNLSFLIKELDAFVADENGVIVLARDKSLEMLSLPREYGAGMSEQKRFARYSRGNFPVFKMEPWGEKEFPLLMRVSNENNPLVIASKIIPQYGLTAYVVDKMNEFNSLKQDASWFAFLLEISGSILILLSGGGFLYVDSIRSEKAALNRANLAERRIISISEDTQQRIGRELHDDLGQLMTGISFMSTVLFKKLTDHGYAEAQDASNITTLVNEAISKTRSMARGLYPVELKEAGLPAMLESLANNVESIYSIKCELDCEGKYRTNDPLAEINLFRIAQEAVNNAIKHSKPTKITLKLTSGSTGTTLKIVENGSGISGGGGLNVKEGLGMRSMQYRASLLGGTFSIISPPDGGTCVAINVPP
jgi:signal transduction histidine kinase